MVSGLLLYKILQLATIMMFGFIFVKLKIIKNQDSTVLSRISLYLLMPATIVNAFDVEITADIMKGLLLAYASAIVLHFILLIIDFIYKNVFNGTSVERASIVYSNAANLIIPIVSFVLGEEYIKVLKVNPMEYPKVAVIPNNLTTLNSIIGTGCIYPCRAESIIIAPHIAIIRAADGVLLDLQGNRMVKDEIIAGTFIVVGFDEHGYIASLSDEDILKYKERFWNIEIYTNRETLKSYWNKFEESLNLMEEEVV